MHDFCVMLRKYRKEKEKTMPFGVNFMAAQGQPWYAQTKPGVKQAAKAYLVHEGLCERGLINFAVSNRQQVHTWYMRGFVKEGSSISLCQTGSKGIPGT